MSVKVLFVAIYKLLFKSICETVIYPLSVYHLSTCHDCPNKTVIINLPIRVKECPKCVSGNLLNQLGHKNMDIGTALQTLLSITMKYGLGCY